MKASKTRQYPTEKGWDGYRADPPSKLAIDRATKIENALIEGRLVPDRIAASAVGGVGISLWHHEKHVYIEAYNDGEAYRMFSTDDPDNDPDVAKVPVGSEPQLVREVLAFMEPMP